MGSDPYWVMRARGGRAGRVEIEVRRPVRPGLASGRSVLEHDPLDVLRSLWPPAPEARDDGPAPPFVGGAVGWLGYELAEWTEPIRLHARDDLSLPDCAWLFSDRMLAFDHETGEVDVWALGFDCDADRARRRAEDAADALAARMQGLPPARPGTGRPAPPLVEDVLPRDLRSPFGRDRHVKAVREILGEIGAGNAYQANLTHRLDAPFDGDPLQLYARLRSLSPAPFAAYLGLPEATLLSSSPERFLRLDAARRAESRPIKGTRPRAASPEADARLRRALAESAKDRAENLMIVDLVRNDLGRVCETGSVEVPELGAVEAYANVFQMVSTVRGRLRADRDAIDLVRATFPPGSMTGAPKIAAMKIIDRLEPVRRGIYSGAIGYLDVRGGVDLSVAIRTLVLTDGRAFLHVGGGIVADSDPEAEWRESRDKARALLAALAATPGRVSR
jgi:para-aminobenzoate synthetase component 1